MKRIVGLAGALLALVSTQALAASDPGTTIRSVLLDPITLSVLNTLGNDTFSTTDLTSAFSDHTQHYGPYASTSPDSGTCGPDWATDTFNRHFTVRQTSTGTFTVYEQFKDGSFVTLQGPSPGGCDTDPFGTVKAGVTGSLHGYFIIPIPAGTMQTSTSPYCDAVAMTNTGCTTTRFINTHFTPACYPVTCTVSTFFFHYSAGDQGLAFHEWKNASCDRGGNQGDIASTAGPTGLRNSPGCHF